MLKEPIPPNDEGADDYLEMIDYQADLQSEDLRAVRIAMYKGEEVPDNLKHLIPQAKEQNRTDSLPEVVRKKE